MLILIKAAALPAGREARSLEQVPSMQGGGGGEGVNEYRQKPKTAPGCTLDSWAAQCPSIASKRQLTDLLLPEVGDGS